MSSPRALVIGAGLAGIAVARELARTHAVTVLEQGPQPGQEASAQNAGMLRRMGHSPAERALACRTAAFLAAPPWGGPTPLRVTGALLAVRDDPGQLAEAAADLRTRGVRVEEPDPQQAAELAPALAGAETRQRWYLPDEGLVDAHLLLTGMLDEARRRGAVLQLRTRVTGLQVDGDRVTGVHTDQGLFEADVVVLASAAWTAGLVAPLGLVRPLVPLARHVLVSEAHPVSSPDHPWLWLDDVGLYVRPEATGWLCSPCDETERVPEPGPDSWGGVDPLIRALALSKVGWYLPALGEPRLARGWTGLRTFTPDREPLLGADPDLGGLWWATGLGGYGVSCGVAAGEAVASWVRGESTPWLDPDTVAVGRQFSSDRPVVLDALAGFDLD